MIELNFLRKLMLVTEVNQKNAIFVTYNVFEIKILSLNRISARGA